MKTVEKHNVVLVEKLFTFD